MANQRRLAAPPIAEALVDFRTTVTEPQSSFEALAQELQSRYPVVKPRRAIRAELKVENGKLIPPTALDLGFQGLMLFNRDETTAVQFRPDGYTYNCLKAYIGGDRLLEEALNLWSIFSARMRPRVVTRVALRYINRLELPFRPGDDFSRYLTAAPVVPEGAPQNVSEFLARVVAHDDNTEAVVITTQQLTVPQPNSPLVVIDVDTFRGGEFSTEADDLRVILEQLRELKNRTFFSLLTEEAIRLYQ